MPCLLGIDNGLTVTKAVVFDENGAVLSVARRRVPQIIPRPRHVERDMAALWVATAEAISEAVAKCGRPASDVAAVATTAHGDGLYLLDSDYRPLGNSILSLDSRAGGIAARWAEDATADRALGRTGQMPHASAPSTLLAWVRDHEPERFARIAHVFACKDWLRFCLAGTVGTDLTEASTAFTDVQTQAYAPDILPIFGLEALNHALPEVSLPDAEVGRVTAEAARVTGLVAGTRVVAGLHDVTASALGVGGYGEGVVAIVAGTYSINETLSSEPRVDARWFCRNGLRTGEWNNMAISPASAANYDWFLDTLCGVERQAAEAEGRSIHATLGPELEAALDRSSTLLFHPYLFGSPHGPAASAGFLGLRGWHDRGDMLRAVIEGIAFNHRVHVDALREGFILKQARLTGGISRNPVFAQLFADALGIPVTVTETEEAAAWGAALCAGAGVGLFASPRHDPRDLATAGRTFSPDPHRSAALAERYRLHCHIADTLAPLWPSIEALAPDRGR
ncbi:FGGY-family carbohydrate kinase [Mesorhizobium sp. VK23B]|uniref:FGGY-family carbohydrate kinase n=1 Tax=Mesorhizobium dulcispinae TaxID=3072316 RepID=A0ABU4X8A1_9HYPH|nr:MULTISPECIES: FGGY-family carbohydrate kinase [unclassified Mesorhizobium]MDX8464646.1 FGGY-family carbohydrate kinase [Mesorhizobium sp. VK23B]MDX8471032.1 FGGY-family carbohydrate kinase [Mesorhizobium sp. VK23A]